MASEWNRGPAKGSWNYFRMVGPTVTTIAHILTGFACGYSAATISESLLHRFIGHANVTFRGRWKRWAGVGEKLAFMHYGHAVVHHGKTFSMNHVTQFRSTLDQQELDHELSEIGAASLVRRRYGLITDALGTLFFAFPPCVCVVVLMWIFFGRISFAFLAAAALPIAGPPALSRFAHPYLHVAFADVKKQGRPFVTWLLATRYGKWVRAAHFVHHRYPNVNFNLLPGGDYLLETYRAPSPDDWEQMLTIGLFDQQD